MNKKVSDIITTEEIKSWNSGDIITIKAGTGRGKSHFIKNALYNFAIANNKKVLMLLHRRNCIDQFELEIQRDKKTQGLKLLTYQTLESLYGKGEVFDFSPYEFIVCDEFHYFLGDASFNMTTDISLSTLLDQSDKTRIFMSATGDTMKNYISELIA